MPGRSSEGELAGCVSTSASSNQLQTFAGSGASICGLTASGKDHRSGSQVLRSCQLGRVRVEGRRLAS
jgi:hypothetical protein